MIVAGTRDGTALRLVTQPDHAFLAAEILALWRSDGLPTHPRRDDLLFATREHDNGWRELDSSPTVDPARGAPRDFLDTPAELRREVWRRGTRRYTAERPYAALLIVEHARHLFRGSAADPAWEAFLSELSELRRDLFEASRAEVDAVRADHAWLDLADRLSLLACGASPQFDPALTQVSRRDAEAVSGAVVVELSPFPLAGATTFRLPCRLVPARAFRGDADFAVEAASAHWTELAITLREPS